MHKLTSDLRDRMRPLYAARAGKPAIVDVPKLRFLAVDGTGDPNEPAFTESIQALYGVAFTIKFALKKKGGSAQRMMPLEALWSCEDPIAPLSEWSWTLLIAQPERVDRAALKAAQKELAKRGKSGADCVRMETITEGKCVQMLHLGPYDEEWEDIETMHAFVREAGYELHGLHHEIYLNDPRRCLPEKIKTILRHPVKKTR